MKCMLLAVNKAVMYTGSDATRRALASCASMDSTSKVVSSFFTCGVCGMPPFQLAVADTGNVHLRLLTSASGFRSGFFSGIWALMVSTPPTASATTSRRRLTNGMRMG